MNYFKLVAFALLGCVLPFCVEAQDDDFEHLLKDRKISFSGFIGPIFEFSSVEGNFGFSSGGGGAIILNQTFFVGGYGLKLAPVIGKEVTYSGTTYQDLEIDFNHGGFWIGYVSNFRKLVHFGGSAKFGWGKIALEDGGLPQNYEDHVLVITPQIEGEVNISKWFKINVGLGYRLVTSVNENVFAQSDFNSPQASIGFLFGWFRQK